MAEARCRSPYCERTTKYLSTNFPNENRMRSADPDGGRSTAQLRYVPHPRSGGRMDREALLGALASFSLFADLSQPELEGISHTFDEEWYSEGQRILRRGFAGSGFHLILEGEAAVRIDSDDRARLGRGDFFGELSALLGEAPSADVVALTPLRCLLLPGSQLHDWLMAKPTIAFRMLQSELRRLKVANEWRS